MKTFEMTDEVIRKKMDALSETINAYITENGIKASAFNRFFVGEGFHYTKNVQKYIIRRDCTTIVTLPTNQRDFCLLR